MLNEVNRLARVLGVFFLLMTVGGCYVDPNSVDESDWVVMTESESMSVIFNWFGDIPEIVAVNGRKDRYRFHHEIVEFRLQEDRAIQEWFDYLLAAYEKKSKLRRSSLLLIMTAHRW